MFQNSFIRRFLLFVIPFGLLIGIDQVTKYLVVVHLKGREALVLIPEVLYFVYVENFGIAFGLFAGHRYFFIFMALLVSIIIFVYAIKMPTEKKFISLGLCLSSIVAGALGNVIDRIRLGYVVDFIYFKPIDFPVFNFADICVTVSFVTVIFLFIFIFDDSDIQKLEIIKHRIK